MKQFLGYIKKSEPLLYDALLEDVNAQSFRDSVLVALELHTKLVVEKFPEYASDKMLKCYAKMFKIFNKHGYRKVMEAYLIILR